MSVADIPTHVHVTYSQQYRRCGKVGCSLCVRGAPGHGPYWYAFWREGGRRHSRYLGKQAPSEVEQAPDGLDGGDQTAPGPSTDALIPGRMAQAPLRVRTLGSLTVWRGETVIPPDRWTSQRAATLFKCLLSAPGQRLRREQAIDALWPEADLANGATNLRTTVHVLRRVLDEPDADTSMSYVRTEGDVLTLTPGGAAATAGDWLDAAAFARRAVLALAGQDATACREAVACYGGEYLPDDPYEPWTAMTRDALRAQYVKVLLHLARLSAVEGHAEEAEDCLRRVLAVEAGHEEAAATLMALLAASGRRGEALRVYQALATALEEDLDVAPAAEIASLRARLLARETAPRTAATVTPRPVESAHPTNLPLALTGFVGRTWEVREVRDRLAAARLVTLTGPGGCGKTRLALEVASAVLDAYPDGVWLVELAALADPERAPWAVATVLGVVEHHGRPLLATVAAFLQPRHALLVLDNCEHLIAACAELARALLASCPPAAPARHQPGGAGGRGRAHLPGAVAGRARPRRFAPAGATGGVRGRAAVPGAGAGVAAGVDPDDGERGRRGADLRAAGWATAGHRVGGRACRCVVGGGDRRAAG